MKIMLAKLFVALFVFAATPTFSIANATSTVAPTTVTPSTSFDPGGFVVDGRDYNDHVTFLYPGHVHINLSGDGDSDLDLKVYNSRGNLVAQSTGRTDDETIHLDVCCPGYATIRVENLGRVYNAYGLWIN